MYKHSYKYVIIKMFLNLNMALEVYLAFSVTVGVLVITH